MSKSKMNNPLSQGKLGDVELTILVDSIRSITSSFNLLKFWRKSCGMHSK